MIAGYGTCYKKPLTSYLTIYIKTNHRPSTLTAEEDLAPDTVAFKDLTLLADSLLK